MIREAINILTQGINLSSAEMIDCMTEIMEGKATDAQIAAFLTALKIKGETVEEITAAVTVMREKSIKIKAPDGIVDTCGTGGDLSHTFNISTTAAIVTSACGIPVAKHGNRSSSSRSGSADVLEALGVKINLSPESVEKCLFETGFGFLFAPLFHPAMKYAVTPRREIGIRTIFNILGPLTNPAGAKRQTVGVFDSALTEPLARVLGNLGAIDAMVFHGTDGLDEVTISNGTRVSRFSGGSVNNLVFTPEDFRLDRASLSDIAGGSREDNARITMEILSGKKGPMRDIVVMNSACALMVSEGQYDIDNAVNIVVETLESGRALKKLEEIKRDSASLSN
ncbi:anthranilate phosphoribosyltransferase [Candidatus Magnetomonas plexicatena]|uniref:anthranilate phosphoribosyltransferase n=1 Tax=Candidatus Magnetomonas plexicatena TaxID=2552947 RepID=UPI0011020DC8|nr:anthranilate phosphoribosyltransferase [Nitrospirales bacterium LBB_01]